MAIAVDGVPVSGSTGNKTYSRNRYGAYIRRRVTPVNPVSVRQNAARIAFSQAVQAWTNTTALIRSGWENWAANTPWINRAGQPTHLSGQAAFIRHYAARYGSVFPATAPSSLVAPVLNNVGQIDATIDGDVELATGTLTVNFAVPAASNSAGTTNGLFFVEMTPGQNLSRSYPGSRWASLGGPTEPTFGWATDAVQGTGVMADFPYGVLVGQRVWFRLRGVPDIATDRRITDQIIVGPATVVAG